MIINYEDLLKIRQRYANKKIVMIKGTFDLFHIGHLGVLKRAKDLGDILVVIIKSNKAVKLKGNDRPIIDENDRAKIVDSIKYTDYTLIANKEFEPIVKINVNDNDLTQYKRYFKIINDLKPNILATAPNHKVPDILLELYKNNSVQLIELERTENISTTQIINQIRELQ